MRKQEHPIWTRSFLSIFMANLLLFTAFYLLLPTLPIYLIHNLKIGTGSVGIVLAVYTIAALVIRPVTGILIDEHGRKYFYLIGLLLFALLFGGYMIAVTMFGIMILRFIHGLTWGVTTTTGSTVVVDLVPSNRRGEGLGYFGLSGTIPMAIGPLIGLQLVSGGNYNYLFIASVVLALIGFAFAWGIRFPEHPKRKSKITPGNLFEISALPVSLVLYINMITYGGVVTFISLYVKETNVGSAGTFFMIYAVGIGLSRLFSGKIFDRQGPVIISVTAFISVAAGFFLLAFFPNIFAFCISAFAMGLGGGILFPTCQAMVNNLVPAARRGAANSTLFTVLDLGIGCGMILLGYLAGTIGLTNAFLVCSLLNILALALFLLYSIRHYHAKKIVGEVEGLGV